MKKINKPLLTGIILILIYTYLNNPEAISDVLKKTFSLFSIFIYGGIIAFLLNPLLKKLEKYKKIKRIFYIFIIYSSLLLLLGLFFSFIIPKLTTNVSDFIENYPKYIAISEKFIEKYKHIFPFLKDIDVLSELLSLQEKFMIFLPQKFTFLINQFLGATATILNLIFSIIFSIFFLENKEYFHNLTKSVLALFFKENTANSIMIFTKRIENVFLGYLSGKSLDSLIIGMIAIFGLFALKIPYALILGIFITILNFVPYIGPFIGILLAIIISLLTNPSNTIFVIIFLVLLQQFDAWVLEPKILGNSLNLSVFWTIAAITLGGGMFGALGIIIAVPIFALIKESYLLRTDIKKKSEEIKD